MSQFVDWCLMSLFENIESSYLHVASLPSLFYWPLKDTDLGTPGQASGLLSLNLHLPMGPTSTSFWDCVHICFKRCLSHQLRSETGREAESVPVWLFSENSFCAEYCECHLLVNRMYLYNLCLHYMAAVTGNTTNWTTIVILKLLLQVLFSDCYMKSITLHYTCHF